MDGRELACIAEQVPDLFSETSILTNHRSLTKDRRDVKPVCGPLFWPKAAPYMMKRNTFLIFKSNSSPQPRDTVPSRRMSVNDVIGGLWIGRIETLLLFFRACYIPVYTRAALVLCLSRGVGLQTPPDQENIPPYPFPTPHTLPTPSPPLSPPQFLSLAAFPHRRRIKTDEKAKVIAAASGAESTDSFLCRASYFGPGRFEE